MLHEYELSRLVPIILCRDVRRLTSPRINLPALDLTAAGVISTGVVSILARITIGRLLELSLRIRIGCAHVSSLRSKSDSPHH